MLGEPLWVLVGVVGEEVGDEGHVEEGIAEELQSLVVGDLLEHEGLGGVYEGGAEEAGVAEFVGVGLFDRGREGELAGRGFGNLILWFGVRGVVVGPFALRVVGAVGEEFDSFDGLVPVRGGPGLSEMVVLHKGCADEGLAHVGDGFVA